RKIANTVSPAPCAKPLVNNGGLAIVENTSDPQPSPSVHTAKGTIRGRSCATAFRGGKTGGCVGPAWTGLRPAGGRGGVASWRPGPGVGGQTAANVFESFSRFQVLPPTRQA